MDALIEALTIFRRYASPQYPTRCEHGVLWVNVNPLRVSLEDLARLEELYFNEAENGFYSSFFGGC